MSLPIKFLFAASFLFVFAIAGQAQATDFVFAPAPVTGKLVSPGDSSGNFKLTFLTVDSDETTITGFGGSIAARSRMGQVFGLNFAGNVLTMEDDDATFTATTVNLMAGPDFYLSDNVIIFADGSFGSTTVDLDSAFFSSSSTTDVTGISYGIQLTLGNENLAITPYYMAMDQTVSSEFGDDVDVSSSVVGVDILVNGLSMAALFQSSDDTDIVMFSIGTNF